ncbi:hypothetical protein [Ammoniphilus sp. CFH 90114]|uniref:hypothetical protein n=1 Tax=Ammoniphilus sp. CFH 90114 TaxID=2493665 RepID=UPI00101001CC|nr:hypothetical protein [Ammoniphilus sp. CFH 90114]RXT00686.1 hypothetical protein EIZ39_25825 [Ammoniphilus sp. CFH 90114]
MVHKGAAAVLYLENQRTVILRNINKTLVNEIRSQCGKKRCICRVDGKEVDYGSVSHVVWMDRADIGD